MSAKPRCHDCRHLRGPRRSNMAKAGIVGQQKGTEHPEQPKKAPCGCYCHRRTETE